MFKAELTASDELLVRLAEEIGIQPFTAAEMLEYIGPACRDHDPTGSRKRTRTWPGKLNVTSEQSLRNTLRDLVSRGLVEMRRNSMSVEYEITEQGLVYFDSLSEELD